MDILDALKSENIEFNITQIIEFNNNDDEATYGNETAKTVGRSDVIDNRSENKSIDFSSSSSSSDVESDVDLQHAVEALNKYVLPVIILVGIVGNSISFFVYIWTPRLSRQSSSFYLAFLSMVDNISLASVLVVWFGWVGPHIFLKNGWCQTITYCTYVCSFLSAWTVVTFTFERWIVVFHPLRRHELCTRRRAFIVMTSLTLASLAFYSFAFYSSTAIVYNDIPVCTSHHNEALNVVHSIDTMITVFVPLLVILLMNTGIGVKICHYTGRRSRVSGHGGGACIPTESADEMYSNGSSLHKCAIDLKPTGCGGDFSARTHGGGGGTERSRCGGTDTDPGLARTVILTTVSGGTTAWRVLTRRHHTQVRVTSALLIVSTVFVVLNLPSYAFRLHTFVIAIRNEKYHISMNAYIWQEIIQFLYYSNISSRFFLYVACSRNFRYAVKRLTCWRRRCGGS